MAYGYCLCRDATNPKLWDLNFEFGFGFGFVCLNWELVWICIWLEFGGLKSDMAWIQVLRFGCEFGFGSLGMELDLGLRI